MLLLVTYWNVKHVLHSIIFFCMASFKNKYDSHDNDSSLHASFLPHCPGKKGYRNKKLFYK